MALRTPVVATSKGAEGLDARNDEHLLIADTPQAFAGAVIRLMKEPELAQRLADKAFQLVREKYDWAVILPRFQSVVDQVIWGFKAG
jgi:glycosyltransferase involved in cell wall biosynthesis